jgi:hypothetical protein
MSERVVGEDGGRSPGSASATSAAAIVASAERLAAEITRNAQAEADAIRGRAGSDSDAARAAIAEHVGRLSALAGGMLERFGELRAELDALSGSLAGPVGSEGPAVAGVDDAGARLIALNLALSDTPRDEATRQLRDQVPDPEQLVDEVYASVER